MSESIRSQTLSSCWNRRYLPKKLAILGVAVYLVASPGVTGAAAQDAQSDTTRVVPLAPIQVRVLRTPVRQDMAALAVASLGEEELREGKSGAFLEEAVRALPGVQVQNRYNFALGEKLIVRGFGGRPQFGVRGVKVIVDGIPATLPDGQGTLDHLDVGSLGRVEVVRGPASSLFGNASGGVVAFESRRPAAAPVRLEAEYVGGSHGLSRFQATASGTVNRTGYLLNVSTQDWTGFRRYPGAGTEGSNLMEYGAANRLGINGQLRQTLGGGSLTLTVNYLDLDSENPGELLKSQVDTLSRVAHAAGAVNNVARRAGKTVEQTQAGLRWARETGGLNTEFRLFGIKRATFNPIVPTIVDLDRDAGGLGIQLGRSEQFFDLGQLRWHFGVEGEVMFDERLNWPNLTTAASEELVRGAKSVDQLERVRSAGIYLQANVPLPARAEALAGLRYDRIDFRAWDNIERAANDPTRTGERTMTALSPSVGVSVPIGELFDVFGNVTTVFETPSTTELGNRPDGEGGFNPNLEAQTGVSGEVGMRGRLAQLLSYELTVYQSNLRNEIVRYQVQTIPGRDFFRNAGRSRHRGAEVTLAAGDPNGLVSGRVIYTFTDARFTSFESDGVEVGGNRIPGIAPQRAEAVLRVNPGIGFGEPDLFFVEFAGSYVDQVPVNDRNTPGFSTPDYFLVDLRGGLRSITVANLTFAPWAAVTNLFDQYYIASVIPNAAPVANPAGARFYDPGPGRSFQVGIRSGWTRN